MIPSLASRMVAAFALLLLGFCVLVAYVGYRVTTDHERETLQRLSQGLARHIVEHWPEVTRPSAGVLDQAAIDNLLHMLMVVNPGIDVYLLDEAGKVRTYVGDPGTVRESQVDIAAVRAFLAGAPLPLLGSDPKSPRDRKIFSAAMFPPDAGASAPPGYLYVVLGGEARLRAETTIGSRRLWRSIGLVACVGLLFTLVVGAFSVRSITMPLRRLAERMSAFRLPGETGGASEPPPETGGDEVSAITLSFEAMADRIERQALQRAAAQEAHREIIANVAHDLRTPLTALHGHLETLDQRGAAIDEQAYRRHLTTALAQSDKVRRLTQQLFELARLQSTDEVLQRDRFRFDELVHDTVQKFELAAQPAKVTLQGPAPGPVELEGDLQLLDRALTNLIDNAIRHGAGAQPVRVSVQRMSRGVTVVVEDDGPGLPDELARRLDAGRPVREPPAARPGGGFGGLGLAIAQRIAWLHGGSLRTLPSPNGGARLCLVLPLVAIVRA